MPDDQPSQPKLQLGWMIAIGAVALAALVLAIVALSTAYNSQVAAALPSYLQNDVCYGAATMKDVVASPPGDHPFTWQCEATAKAPTSDALHWFRDAREYGVLAEETYARATTAADALDKKYGAQGYIVLMDADETLLDNSDYQKANESCRLTYRESSWCDWVRAEAATAIPGAAAFVKFVHDHHGYVAVVTNRFTTYQRWTEENFHKLGIAPDIVLSRDPKQPSDKAARWRDAIAKLSARHTAPGKPAPVAAVWVGDQITDFPTFDAQGAVSGALQQMPAGALSADFGTRFFLLPQPLYGGWVDNARR